MAFHPLEAVSSTLIDAALVVACEDDARAARVNKSRHARRMAAGKNLLCTESIDFVILRPTHADTRPRGGVKDAFDVAACGRHCIAIGNVSADDFDAQRL